MMSLVLFLAGFHFKTASTAQMSGGVCLAKYSVVSIYDGRYLYVKFYIHFDTELGSMYGSYFL
jgi:hypothetical protein